MQSITYIDEICINKVFSGRLDSTEFKYNKEKISNI